MFAGKTSALIDWIAGMTDLRSAQRPILVLKHCLDNRYSEAENDAIVSHDKRRWPAKSVGNLTCCLKECKKYAYIAIDEAQFFEDLDSFLIEVRALDNVEQVYVAGLDLTYKREPFGKMREAMELADEKIRLYAECSVCQKEAMFTHLNTLAVPESCRNETIIIGGDGLYSPRCAEHIF
jgi:thymidine kinase